MHKIILLSVLCLSFSFLSFRDSITPKTVRINDLVIKRVDDGVMYQKGIIYIKLKELINQKNSKSFGIPKLDNFLLSYGVTSIKPLINLNPDPQKRKIMDEDIAKIFMIRYSADIDPIEFSRIVFENNSDIIEYTDISVVCEPDFIPNDPMVGQQWHISKINCYQAWDLTQGDTSVVIGIVDSGSDLDHPDLAANIKYNYNDPINNIDDDNNGYIDDFAGWDFYYSINDPNIVGNGNDHGSHVSGCASQVANNNVHGAGPGFKVKLRITKHAPNTGENLIYYSDQGITYQYQNGAKIINCSFGSSYFSQTTQNIINAAWANGTILVGSAGNEGLNTPRYPASYDHAISVASTGSTDIKSSFSNYHSTVDVCAPGENILSTVYNNTYTVYSGTSMSAPITSGVVGLIRSKYPSWSPQQVSDRLILGVDSIYNLNPGFEGLIGSGRINAFKCVSDLPIIRLISYTHNDSVYGNNDHVYDIGEKIPILITYKNTWLVGNNVSLRLTTEDPDVDIVKDSIFVGNLAAYATYSTNYSNTFEVKAKSTCPFDKNVTFRISNSNTAYGDNNANTITITFRQGWATHTVNNMKLSLTRDGAIGKKTQSYGSGLFVPGSSVNQLLESGLMIGVSNTKVSDVCRRGTTPANVSDTDFVGLSAYTLTTPGVLSDQDGSGLFNDDGAGSNKIGVEVKANSYAFTAAADVNYILLKYRIKNTSGSNINNMYVGVYSFYSPAGATSGNITKLDESNHLGYTYNTNTSNIYLGTEFLTGQNLNFRGMMGAEVLTGFTTQEKWNALSSGIFDTITIPSLNCFVISGGPINLNNNDSTVVSFAIVKGSDLNDLRTNAISAKNKYNSLIGIQPISSLIPLKFELFQNYPNPFNPSTSIKFALPISDYVSVKIYDILGKEVATVVSAKLNAGVYKIDFNSGNLASGVYFYRLNSGRFSDVKKMIILK